MTEPCVFCAIVDGTGEAWIVDEDEWTIAFLDVNQAAPGHTLVVPKRHADDLWDVAPDDAARVMAMVHRVAARIRDRIQPDGLTVAQTNRHAGGQEVFHLHVHVIPRFEGDGFIRSWMSVPADRDELTRNWGLLTSAAAEAGTAAEFRSAPGPV